jgi:cytochrome c5
MSKQDSHFFNNFSLVLGILFAVTIGLFVFARHIGEENQGKQVLTDPRYVESVKTRLQPEGRVALNAEDNAALAIKSVGPEIKVSLPSDGPAAYNAGCNACHAAGVAGAPKVGDKAAWAPRIAQGKDTLYKHALEGLNRGKGIMPPKGGQTAWPDDLIHQTVDFMVDQSK